MGKSEELHKHSRLVKVRYGLDQFGLGVCLMSLQLIESEVRRFLVSESPAVICIKGKWGVGKTYTWNKFLKEAVNSNALGLRKYSYVSLFGLNSLDDLRYAIFERTVSGSDIGVPPTAESFQKLFQKSGGLTRLLKPAVDTLAAVFNRKGISDLLYKSAFLSVENQIICLDDLERAGKGLDARDVLGLASMLKEERKCKVVLLLNEQEHDQRLEFERQLEKVADISLTFDLTATEAVSIALENDSRSQALLRSRIVDLGITNIRVIKKIDRLAADLVEILDGIDDSIVASAVATVALAGWSVHQPQIAPPLQFLRPYRRFDTPRTQSDEKSPDSTMRFRKILENYPFHGAEDLDHLIFDGAEAGYFRRKDLREAAEKAQENLRRQAGDSKFTRAWEELYHGSLATEDDEFLDALFESSCSEAGAITPLNINGAITMLRRTGRNDQADELIKRYVEAHDQDGVKFFDVSNHHFFRDNELDERLRDAFDAKFRAFVDGRDPLATLTAIGERRGWGNDDFALMATQSADSFERMFETLRGDVMRHAIEMIVLMGNSNHHHAASIKSASYEALRRIADKSPLRALKISRFQIDLGDR